MKLHLKSYLLGLTFLTSLFVATLFYNRASKGDQVDQLDFISRKQDDTSSSINTTQATQVFPQDADVVNVLSFGAIPNDGEDDTAAIQAALNLEANGNRIVYLPQGTYLVSDRLDWPSGAHGGLAHKRTILQGSRQEQTIIQLQDNAAGYQDPDAPQAVLWTGTAPAQRFRNAIRDLTVNTGIGNPGAIGVQFIANNQGGLRHVTIESGDGQGVMGLDMSYTDEIGPLYVKNLHVSGFDYGIKTYWQTASLTFEDITLENQNRLGWENFGQAIFIRGLTSFNTVPALKNVKDNPSSVVLVDAELINPNSSSSQAAIINEKGMFLRNVETSGYAMLVSHDDKGRGNEPGVFEPKITEWLSHGDSPLSLFESSQESSLNLAIQSPPEIPWDPISEWVSPLEFGAKPNDGQDDTAAIQAAIDSGATTVYLPNGTWEIEGNLSLRNNVRRFLGTEARLVGNNQAQIVFEQGSEPVVQLERLDIQGKVDIVHGASRTLVLSSLSLSGEYSNTGSGDLFIEDVVGGPFYFQNQRVWARQINPETDTQQSDDPAKIVNDGGQLWMLGVKTERPGTVVQTINGGQTEVLGGFIYSTGGEKVDPAFVNVDSSVSLAGVVERNFNSNPFQVWVEETRGNETWRLDTEQLDSTGLYIAY